MTAYEWDDTAWRPATGVPLSDRAFRHGMSAFATIRLHHGHPVFLDAHLEKLRATCNALGLRSLPDALAATLRSLFFSSELERNDGSIDALLRLTVTAGDGPIHAPLDQGRIFLFIDPLLDTPPPETLVIADTTHTPIFSGLKTGNYWPQIDAHRSARQRGADEIVLVNSARHVISASLANLFAVIDGLLLTPRTSSGARSGVMRDWVLQNADIIISDFHPEQLRDAQEIFLTNSRYGIAPIRTLDSRALPSQATGTALRQTYLQYLDTVAKASVIQEPL